MSWLALVDKAERRYSLRGIGHDRKDRRLHPESEDYLLRCGSIVFETRISPDRRPQPLLAFNRSWPNQRSLTFQAIPGGGISMVQVEGETIAHAAVQHALPARTDVLRVTFSWDCRRQLARLTVERPETHQITSTIVRDVQPLPLADLRRWILGRGDQRIDPDVIFLALSDEFEAVGPSPTLHPDAMIETGQGFRRAGDLTSGDTLRSRDGNLTPILHRVDRVVPARGSAAPLRLRAPYFGLRDDVVVAPEQRLVIDGSEVEYLFNQEAVLVPARHLVNGFSATEEPVFPTARYTQFILPAHETICAAGTMLESLYLGRLRRNTGLLPATILHRFERNHLPEHAAPVYKELQWYDAIHLARQRVA
ncbi:MAG: Hint domain-containing protein [Pseudomonadota bacterium]